MSQYPKITVITASFNSAKTLARAMDSLVAQEYPNLEYLVMDGGSTDGTQDVIKRYENHITFWRSHKDEGTADACNEAFGRMTGKIVCLLNSDDWFEPGILRAVAEAFTKYPDIAVVTCGVRLVQQGENGLEVLREFKDGDLAMDGRGSLVFNGRFFRRSIYEKHGLFTVKDRRGNKLIAVDLDFMLRLFLAQEKQIVLPQFGYTYFAHAGSYTFSGSQKMSELLHRQRGEIAERFLSRDDLPPHILRQLKRWNTLGTTRDFLWALKACDWKEAGRAAKQGLRIQPVYWPMYLVKISFYKLVGIKK